MQGSSNNEEEEIDLNDRLAVLKKMTNVIEIINKVEKATTFFVVLDSEPEEYDFRLEGVTADGAKTGLLKQLNKLLKDLDVNYKLMK